MMSNHSRQKTRTSPRIWKTRQPVRAHDIRRFCIQCNLLIFDFKESESIPIHPTPIESVANEEILVEEPTEELSEKDTGKC